MTQTAAEQENPRKWLEDCCGDPWREQIATPFLLEHEGQTYEAATNGHAMVAVLGAGVTSRTDAPKGAVDFLKLSPVELGRASVRELAQWGEAVECYCGTCDFAGAVEYRHPIRPPFCLGKLFGRLVNRWYVWRFLHALDGEVSVRSTDSEIGPIQFVGDGFIVVLMPCDPNRGIPGDTSADSEFPRQEPRQVAP